MHALASISVTAWGRDRSCVVNVVTDREQSESDLGLDRVSPILLVVRGAAQGGLVLVGS
jgi:hypothetical protein